MGSVNNGQPLPGFHTIKSLRTPALRPESHDQVFCTFFLHQCFLSYHTWSQFSCLAFCQKDASRLFSKQIAEAIPRIFFAVKPFTQVLRYFFEICHGTVILCSSSIHYYFSFAKVIRARSQKRKAAAIVINSYLSSDANCVPKLWICFWPAMKWIYKWKMSKTFAVWNSLAYSLAFFMLCCLSWIKFALHCMIDLVMINQQVCSFR